MLPRPTLIVVHGIGQKPEWMLPLANAICPEARIELVTLSGHEKKPTRASAALWKEQLGSVVESSQVAGSPLHLLAYSLGAAVTVQVLDEHPQIKIERINLLAPALCVTRFAQLMRVVMQADIIGMAVPSLVEPKYRVHALTPLRNYRALFEILDCCSQLKNPARFKSLPVAVCLCPKDRLVNFTGIKAWLQHQGLTTSVKVHEVTSREKGIRASHHLLFDKEKLAVGEWEKMVQAMTT